MAHWIGCQICDGEVAGSIPGYNTETIGSALARHTVTAQRTGSTQEGMGGEQRRVSVLYIEHIKETENSLAIEKRREVVRGSLYPISILGLSLPRPVGREFNKLYELLSQLTCLN